MTKVGTVLSVRLDPALATALDRHCAQTGATRSLVVQQSMAQYLATQSGPTLGELAEALLPAIRRGATRSRDSAPRPARQQRFRDRVHEKRRR